MTYPSLPSPAWGNEFIITKINEQIKILQEIREEMISLRDYTKTFKKNMTLRVQIISRIDRRFFPGLPDNILMIKWRWREKHLYKWVDVEKILKESNASVDVIWFHYLIEMKINDLSFRSKQCNQVISDLLMTIEKNNKYMPKTKLAWIESSIKNN